MHFLFGHLQRSALVLLAAAALSAGAQPAAPGMAAVAGGSYTPLYSGKAPPRTVRPFLMDVTQVTNGQFLEFVTSHPEWRRSRVTPAQADANYLSHWAGDLDLGPRADELRHAPVTYVSWHAAKAYCESQGKRLPLQDEWEFAARADATRPNATADPAYLKQLLDWYAKPASVSLASASTGAKNVHGLRGLHGLVWEWVGDFNSTLMLGDARGDGTLERDLFCGAGSLLAADAGNYAAYMRYAFRSSLKGDYCVGSLGFRAAKSAEDGQPPAAAPPLGTLYDLPGQWLTSDGTPATLASLRGKVRVLTMGFTRCQFACPRIFGDMQRLEKELGAEADRVGFVFLSIDPDNDTPAQMKRTQNERKMDSQRWTFLAAPADTVRPAAVTLNFKYHLVDGFFSHSNLIAVLDAEGHVVHREEALGANSTATLRAIRKLLVNQAAAN